MDVDREINLLLEELQRFGGRVKFGVLCRDDRCSNMFEALGGTLKAAKKRKLIGYDSELLLQGAHDDVEIYMIDQQEAAAATAPTAEPAAAGAPASDPKAAPSAGDVPVAAASASEAQPVADSSAAPADV